MKNIVLEELESLVKTHIKADVLNNKEVVVLLLKEFTRRMVIWRVELEKNKVAIKQTGILYDIAFSINGTKVEIPQIGQLGIEKTNTLKLSFLDQFILSAYFNWKYFLNDLEKDKYNLPNPYTPYIEIFKLGGQHIKCKYGRLEVYPFIGIKIHPRENFLTDTPFWEEIA